MNIVMNDLAITSLETIAAFELVSGAYLWTLDELQNATIAQTQDTQEVTGKAGRILNRLKKNKQVTISATNGLVSGGLLEVQTGGSFEHVTKAKVRWTDYRPVTNDAATTTYKAVGAIGSEIKDLYIHNTDGTLGARYTQGSSVEAGKFTYNPSTKALTFNADEIPDGTEIVIFYDRYITSDVLANKSDAYSGKAQLYIDALAEDSCGVTYHVQFYVPKADFSGEFSLELGGDQAVHSFEATALAGGCGNGDIYWTYTVFGANAPDYSGS